MFSQHWLHWFGMMTVQNTIFLAGILLLLYLLRDHNPRFLRFIALLGLLKLFIPPILFPQAGTAITTNLALPTIIVTPEENIAVKAGSDGISLTTILLLVWLAGLCGFLLFSGLKILALRYTRQYSREIPWPGRFENSEKILLSRSSKVNPPLIAGLFSKQILVPKYWNELSDGSKQSIIHHELAHLEQNDHWILVFQILGTIINFFNPLVWILNNKINTLSELTCDDRALNRSQIESGFYVKSLVEVAEISTLSRLMTMAPAFSESYHNLKSRINYQLERSDNMHSRFSLKHIIGLFLIGLFILPFSCDMFEKAPSSSQEINSATESETVTNNVPLQPITVYDVTSQSEMPPPMPDEPEESQFDQPPKMIGGLASLQQNLEYPEAAKEAGVEGTIVIRIFINQDGTIDQISMRASKGGEKEHVAQLARAASEALTKTSWEPATRDGKPVGVWYSIPFNFQLGDN